MLNNFYYLSLSFYSIIATYLLQQTIANIIVFFANTGLGHRTSFRSNIPQFILTITLACVIYAAFYAKEYARNLKIAAIILTIPYIIAIILGIIFLVIIVNSPSRWN